MTVRRMIKQLLDYPMDSQVVDTDCSPIMYMLFHNRKGNAVRLEPKSQIDVDAEIEAILKEGIECAELDRDTYEELKERGFTLDDLRAYNYDTYMWAKTIEEEE